jgi:hypothetical protein
MKKELITPDDVPSKDTKELVVASFGKWAGRVLSEDQDPRFLNPLIGVTVENGVVHSRLREFWRDGCTTSVSRPQHGSLTEEYVAKGLVIPVGDIFVFKGQENIDPETGKILHRPKQDAWSQGKDNGSAHKKVQINIRKKVAASNS